MFQFVILILSASEAQTPSQARPVYKNLQICQRYSEKDIKKKENLNIFILQGTLTIGFPSSADIAAGHFYLR